MALDWLLNKLGSLFDQKTTKSLIAAYRNNPLLWKELEKQGLPEAWIEFANSDSEAWHPGILAIYFLDPSLARQDLTNLSIQFPLELTEKAAKVLETVRLTGLEPANLKDVALLAVTLRNFHTDQESWKGLFSFLTEGKTKLQAWKSSLSILPDLSPDFEAALDELIHTCPTEHKDALSELIVSLMQSFPLTETQQYEFLSKLLENADLEFQVKILDQLQGVVEPSFVKLLANSFLINQNERLEDAAKISPKSSAQLQKEIEKYQNLAMLNQFAGQTQKASQAIELAFKAINSNQASLLRGMAIELEQSNPEEARKTWEEVLRLLPDNDTYRTEYAEFLLKHDESEFASDLLSQVKDDQSTALFALRYPQLRIQTTEAHQALDNAMNRKTLPTGTSRFGLDSDNLKAAQYAFENKQYQIAGDYIKKAVQENPNNLDTIRMAAKIHQRLANLEEAIESSALLAIFEPDNQNNNKELARLYLQTHQGEKALDIYGKIIEDYNQADRGDLLTYAEIAIKAGKPERAIPISESFLAHDQLDGEALVLLSRALIASNQKSQAVELLDRASAIAPEKPTSWLSLARIWIDLGEQEQAKQSLRKAKAALPGDPQILTALGKLYLENEEITDAISALKQAFELDSENPEVRKSLAAAWLKQGYLDEAWETVSPLEEDYASDPELALILGRLALEQEDLVQARPWLKFAWQSLKNDEALLAYSACLIGLNDKHPTKNQEELETLLEALETKSAQSSDDFEIVLLTTDLQAAVGQAEEAYSGYLKLLDWPQAKAPRAYHHLQLQIGKTAGKLGLNDISLASLQEAMLINPDNLETRHILTKAFLDSDLAEEANNTARSALQIAPADLENVLWFSQFMSDNGNEKESIQVLKDAIHLRPEDKTLYLTLARIHARANDLNETKTVINKMLSLDSITTEEYVDVANLYFHLNETEEASSIILKAISDNPSPDFEETRNLVYSILRLGDVPAAEKLTDDLRTSIGNHPCYAILVSDVLTANKKFMPALENLKDLLNQVEFSSENECLVSQKFSESVPDFPPYTKSGLYYRAAQVERLTGDLIAAQKHADMAQKENPQDEDIIILQAGLALSLRNSQKLESVLDYLNPQALSGRATQDLVQMLTLEALLQDDAQKISMLWEHFLSSQGPDAFYHAVEALNQESSGSEEDAIQSLTKAFELLESQQDKQNKAAFDISDHFQWIWSCLAVSLAAWKLSQWEISNKSLASALSTVRVNPVANQLLAAYISDNQRQHNNASLLHENKHAPEFFPSDDSLELLEEQVALAGRFLKPSALMSQLKIGQAVFGGHWNDDDDLALLVTNGRQAAQALSVLVNPEKIRQISDTFGNDSEVLFQQAILNLYQEPQLSQQLVDRLLEERSNDPELFAIRALALRDQPEKAAESIEKALEIWPDEDEWHAFAANMYQDARLYAQAASHLEEALQISPKSAHYWQLLGDVKLLEKDYHAAKDYFGKASDLFPDNPQALDSLARINQQLGEHQIAIQCWQKAMQVDPTNPTYLESIAESYLARKEFSQAISQANQVLQVEPNSSRALLVKARAEIGLGKPSEARQTILAAKTVVDNAIPFELLSIELDSVNKPNYGVNAAQLLVEEYPESPAVLNKLAGYQIEAGLLEKAANNLRSSLSIDESNPETLTLLGKIDRMTGHLDKAISNLDQAIKLDPSRIEAYLEMGQTYQERREIPKAIETYHRAISMVEKDPRPYVQAAAAYKESRDYRNAEYMLRQAAQFSPTDQSIRRQLAALVALNLVNNLQEAPKRK
jgi:tetratricopeptide (TPR) repeat protein